MKPLSSTSNFNIYFKRIAAFVIAFCVFYAAVGVSAQALSRYFDDRNGTQKITGYQMADFYALPENSIDVLILGSSHAMCSYNPEQIESNFGMQAFNLGTALQQPDTAYYLLREVLKTQKPKYLVYDVYFKVMLDEYSNEQAVTVLKEMKPSSNSVAMYWDNLVFEDKLDLYNNWINPFARIEGMAEVSERISDVRVEAYRGRGFYSTDGVVQASLLAEEKHPFSKEYSGFNERQVKYLKKLIALAQENGIEVILTSAPLPPTILSRIDYYDKTIAEIEAIATLFDIEYIDFAKSSAEFLSDFDFADQGHLNRKGNAKFMEHFIEKMKESIFDGKFTLHD